MRLRYAQGQRVNPSTALGQRRISPNKMKTKRLHIIKSTEGMSFRSWDAANKARPTICSKFKVSK